MRGKLKSRRKLIIFIISIFLVIVTAGVTLFFACSETEAPKYSVGGRVTVGGEPLVGFAVDSTFGSCVTDENGAYVFEGVTGEITVSFSDDEYYFGNLSKTFSSQGTFDADGKPYRSVSGVVKNGSTPVALAGITVAGLNGSYFTVTDGNGAFNVDKLAGEVTIRAAKDGKEFFSKTLGEGESSAEINATSPFGVAFVYEEGLENVVFEYALDGEKGQFSGDSLEFDGVSYGSTLEFFSEEYAFSRSSFAIEKENDRKTIYVYKKYDLSGSVFCGNAAVGGAEIRIDGVKYAETDANGGFLIEDLFGKHTVTAHKDGFTDVSLEISKDSGDVDFSLLYCVDGRVIFESKGLADVAVSCGEKTIYTDENGRYELQAAFGETLTFEKSGYFIDGGGEICSGFDGDAVAHRYYDAVITVEGDVPDVITALIGGTEYEIKGGELSLENIYGEKTLELRADGYYFEYPAVINRFENRAVIRSVKIFDVDGRVFSGNIALDAEIFVGGKLAGRSENGEFSLKNLKKGDVIEIRADGYDTFEKTLVGSEKFIDAELTYSVRISAECGGRPVKNYVAEVNGRRAETGETAVISGLCGQVTVNLIKDYYDFETLTVRVGGNYVVNATYTVQVKVSGDGVDLSGYRAILIDKDTDEIATATTDADGAANFDGLGSEYVLFVEGASAALKPDYYDVAGGGVYAFSDSGFGFTGRVTVGGKGLEGVKLTAGDRVAYTDDDGNYRFEMITSECTLKIEKTGYSFDKQGLALDGELDGSVIEVCATYSVRGTVKSGDTPVEGVTVCAAGVSMTTDENGDYVLSGIAQVDCLVTFEKDGFIIDGAVVSGPQTLSPAAYVDVEFTVTSGELAVEGVVFKANGVVADRFVLGDTVTFEKDGYDFPAFTVEKSGAFVIDGTYSVRGGIYNGDELISGVTVMLNGEFYVESSDGTFEISGLKGENEISFVCDGFDVESVLVGGPCEISATTYYDVSVTVRSGDAFVGGVTVEIGGKTAITGADGRATVEGVSGVNAVNLSKAGYEFSGESKVSGKAELEYGATYSVSGKVSAAGKGVEGVCVSDGMRSVFTLANGEYTIGGLKGECVLTYEKDGYQTTEVSVAAPETRDVSLKFYISVTFDGLEDYSGISVFYGDNEIVTENSDTLMLGGFTERVTVTFEKDGCKFTPAKFTADGYIAVTVNVKRVYAVDGRIVTASGVPVAGMTVSGGGVSSVTDGNGNFRLEGLSGEIQISGKFDGITHSAAFTGDKFSGAGSYTGVVSDADYAWALYELNYEKRLKTDGVAYEIYGSGTVDAGAGGMQTAGAVKKKDSQGNILTQNFNYGNVVFGVDPKVSLLSYYDKGSGAVTYTQVKNVSSGLVSDYTGAAFTDTDMGGYMSVYGTSVANPLVYNITADTVKSLTNVRKEGSSFSMTMELEVKSTGAAWSGYEKQVEKMSAVDVTGFNSITLAFTFDENGRVTKLKVNESYVVKKMGISVTTNASLTYEYNYPAALDLSGFEKDNAVINRLLAKS